MLLSAGSVESFILPSPLPKPPAIVKPVAPPPSTPPPQSRKRPAPDDADQPLTKRARTNGAPGIELTSPSKKRRLEEDGLVMLESAGEELRDDIIEID